MQDGRGARVCCEQTASSGGDGKQVCAVRGNANCKHPPGRHYDRPARSSLTDDPDIMPGDEKRSRRRQDTANGAPGGAAQPQGCAHIRTGSASWRAVPFAFSKGRRESASPQKLGRHLRRENGESCLMNLFPLIPAQAGIQLSKMAAVVLDSRLRGNERSLQ
jgi:hypothetical protein